MPVGVSVVGGWKFQIPRLRSERQMWRGYRIGVRQHEDVGTRCSRYFEAEWVACRASVVGGLGAPRSSAPHHGHRVSPVRRRREPPNRGYWTGVRQVDGGNGSPGGRVWLVVRGVPLVRAPPWAPGVPGETKEGGAQSWVPDQVRQDGWREWAGNGSESGKTIKGRSSRRVECQSRIASGTMEISGTRAAAYSFPSCVRMVPEETWWR